MASQKKACRDQVAVYARAALRSPHKAAAQGANGKRPHKDGGLAVIRVGYLRACSPRTNVL